MDRLAYKRTLEKRRAHRVRQQLKTSEERPRLSVHISQKTVSAQIIDKHGKIVGQANSAKINGSLTEQANAVGKAIAAAAKSAKIKQVSLDRGSRLYHGRLKALAESARQAGLEL